MNEIMNSRKPKVLGIAMIVLGVVAMVTPLVAGLSMLMLIGMVIAVAGILRMVWAFRAETPGQGIFKFLLGILTAIAGGLIMAHPLIASGVLSILLAAYLLMDGLVEVIVAFTLTGHPGKGWLMATGLISIVLGCLIFFQAPLSGTMAIGVFLGIKLVFVGLATLNLGATPHSFMETE